LRAHTNRISIDRDELANQVARFQQELTATSAAMERRAEISVDERLRAKSENIKAYFDSHITRILMGTGEVDKAL
jgi:hypothetical protein